MLEYRMACTGNCSNKSVNHVITFDGTNLPLWRLGLNVALEEAGVQFVTDGTDTIPPEVHTILPSKLSLLNIHIMFSCLHRDQFRHCPYYLVSIETSPDIALTTQLLSSSNTQTFKYSN